MSNPIITVAAVKAALWAAVAERGEDYVYRPPEYTCLYWHHDVTPDHPGEPGCIAGWVFRHFDVAIPVLNNSEGSLANMVLNHLADAGWRFEDKDRISDLLVNAQEYQDDMQPWGEAVALAIENDERDHGNG